MKEFLKQISSLVERFERNIEAYRSPAYNETQLRREFIDPFFEALGWDVTNKAGYAEQYKDVIHEDAIKIAGATKAPDYCFRIGGVRKFFLETKKPSIDIKSQISPAYQLRRYAWSAKLPLSILTDFEEMAIYDCRLRPKPNDKPSIGESESIITPNTSALSKRFITSSQKNRSSKDLSTNLRSPRGRSGAPQRWTQNFLKR